MRIDPHAHTSHSDGTDSPTELVRKAREVGLDVVGITDHDTFSGWEEAAAEAVRIGVGLVRGVEITCSADGISVHLLGLLPRPDDGPLAALLAANRSARPRRARTMVERLAADFPISWEGVLALAGSPDTIGRPHMADALVAAGVVPDRSAAFEEILASSAPYYLKIEAPQPADAVRAVVGAGGVAVMAHPFAAKRGRVVADVVIREMAEAGLAGLEAHHRDHTPEQREHAVALAGELGLLVTGASDYHGLGKPNGLGENLTEPAVLEAIEERAALPVIRTS